MKLKLSTTNEWLTLIANLGVLIGVILVAYELQQDRLATEAQIRFDITNMATDALQRWAENPEIITAMQKTIDRIPLTDEEQLMMFYIRMSELRRWENTYSQYQRGLFDETEFDGFMRAWEQRINSSIYTNFWDEERKSVLREDFAELIDSLVHE